MKFIPLKNIIDEVVQLSPLSNSRTFPSPPKEAGYPLAVTPHSFVLPSP